ncbi:MAG: nucleotide sugar dehydrogenase [Candidatus Altiarchaeota archaeon]|nr:nucleotide sugar dehydrogenase [Candidatus Altiarchaeota archaeon]
MKIYGKGKEEIVDAFRNGEVTVAVYGLGKMGLPLAAVFAGKGAKVIGVDVSEEVVEGINNGVNHIREEPGLDELVARTVESGNLRASTNLVEAAGNSDVLIILVPTLIRDNKPDLSIVHSVAKGISSGLMKGDIVITECTMPPGSTEDLIPVLEESGLKVGRDFGLGHCPERTMTGTALRDITGQYPKIVGAGDEGTETVLTALYSVINSRGVIPVSGIKAAELVKVFEGVYRDVNIALANELNRVCDRLNVDYMAIQEAANTQPYSHLHTPGGVGGHCIPYYPYFVMDKDTVLLRTARGVNDSIPDYIIHLIKEVLRESERDLGDSNIMILGISFRGGVKETIKSTAIEVIEKLKPLSGGVYAFDPLFSKEEVECFNVIYSEGFGDMDCVVIASDHDEFRGYNWGEIAGELRTKAVVDTRQVINPKEVRELGFIYRGLGYI